MSCQTTSDHCIAGQIVISKSKLHCSILKYFQQVAFKITSCLILYIHIVYNNCSSKCTSLSLSLMNYICFFVLLSGWKIKSAFSYIQSSTRSCNLEHQNACLSLQYLKKREWNRNIIQWIVQGTSLECIAVHDKWLPSSAFSLGAEPIKLVCENNCFLLFTS